MLILLLLTDTQCAKLCNTEECNDEAESRTVFEVGDLMALDMEIKGTLEGKEVIYYSRFYPETDKFTTLEIQDGASDIYNLESSSVTFTVNNITSPPFIIREGNNPLVPTFLSAMILLDKGTITGIGWDQTFDTNGCVGEKGNHVCLQSRPIGQESGSAFQTFLAFAGTTQRGTHCDSGQYMPSTFMKFGLGGVIDSATDFFNKVVDVFK